MPLTDSIKYFSRSDCPGTFFDCERLCATLTTASCEKRWKAANDKARKPDPCDPLLRCKACDVGAAHSGEKTVKSNPLFGSRICSRCQRPSDRLVGGELCVSCYNRQREYRIGRNAKGTRPINHPALEMRRALVLINGAPRVREFPNTVDMTEAIVSVLRHESGPVVFAFKSRKSWVQLTLL